MTENIRAHWSYSSLNQLLNICSLQWAFQRLYKLPPEFKSAALSFGNAFHRTLEWVAHRRKEGHVPTAAETAELFACLWPRQLAEDGDVQFEEGADAAELATQGRSMMACVIANIAPEEQVLAVNQTFCVPLVDAQGVALEKPLVGEMDCLVAQSGQTAIVDWKSSARRWAKDKPHKDLQPTAYLYAGQFQNPPVTVFRYDVVTKTKTPAFEQHATTRNPAKFHRLVALVKQADRLVQQELFYPHEQGFYCAGCGYQNACQAWQSRQRRVISLAA